MVSENSRIVIFNTFCIASRISLILILFFFPYSELAVLTGLIGLGFIYSHYLRKNDSGFGGRVYWPRLLHGFLYIIATVLLIVEKTREYAFYVLILDLAIGYFIFLEHYKLVKKFHIIK